MSLHVPHVPEPANEAANKFARLLDRDGYGPTVAMRMIAAIVDHARAVRVRCDARAHLTEMRRTMCTEHLYSGADEEHARIVHGLAKHTTIMTRRDLPRLITHDEYSIVNATVVQSDVGASSGTAFAVGRYHPTVTVWQGEVSVATRDAGHDLLASLICEVEASP